MGEISQDHEPGQPAGQLRPRAVAKGPPQAQRRREQRGAEEEPPEAERPRHVQPHQRRQGDRGGDPAIADDPEAEPQRRDRRGDQRERDHRPFGEPDRQEADRGEGGEVPGPVRQGFQADRERRGERAGSPPVGQNLSIIKVGRAVLGRERRRGPDRQKRRRQGQEEQGPGRPDGPGVGLGSGRDVHERRSGASGEVRREKGRGQGPTRPLPTPRGPRKGPGSGA